MPFTAEVSTRRAQPKSCQGLLYAPLDDPLSYLQTQRYVFEYTGSEDALTAFIRKVLVDDVCQDLHLNEIQGPPITQPRFLLGTATQASQTQVHIRYIHARF